MCTSAGDDDMNEWNFFVLIMQHTPSLLYGYVCMYVHMCTHVIVVSCLGVLQQP